MAGGRPTKYRVEYCEKLQKHFTSGLSFESFGGVVQVSRDTLYEWCKKHKQFADAKKKYETSSLIFWEKLGRNGAAGKVKGFNVAAWIFTMKNRFKWTDRAEEEKGHFNGKIEININKDEIDL